VKYLGIRNRHGSRRLGFKAFKASRKRAHGLYPCRNLANRRRHSRRRPGGPVRRRSIARCVTWTLDDAGAPVEAAAAGDRLISAGAVDRWFERKRGCPLTAFRRDMGMIQRYVLPASPSGNGKGVEDARSSAGKRRWICRRSGSDGERAA